VGGGCNFVGCTARKPRFGGKCWLLFRPRNALATFFDGLHDVVVIKESLSVAVLNAVGIWALRAPREARL